FHRLAIRGQLHWGRHHLAIQRHVKDFLAVLVPARLRAAVTGDLKLPARPRKRPCIYLELSGFVRLISDPLAIGRELAVAFLKGSFQEREWLLLARRRQYPQIPACLGI